MKQSEMSESRLLCDSEKTGKSLLSGLIEAEDKRADIFERDVLLGIESLDAIPHPAKELSEPRRAGELQELIDEIEIGDNEEDSASSVVIDVRPDIVEEIDLILLTPFLHDVDFVDNNEIASRERVTDPEPLLAGFHCVGNPEAVGERPHKFSSAGMRSS